MRISDWSSDVFSSDLAPSTLPLVYSCSGCSNVAQLANTVALRLDSAGLAEMSCIVGVGGHVPALVNKASSGRRIIGLDRSEERRVGEEGVSKSRSWWSPDN